jgi:hypothetical protein
MATATKAATKPAATKKAATAKQEDGLYGYCMKTKQKELMLGTTIQLKGNRYIASGADKDGNKITLIMSAEQAQAAIDKEWAELVEEEPTKPAKKAAAPAKKK